MNTYYEQINGDVKTPQGAVLPKQAEFDSSRAGRLWQKMRDEISGQQATLVTFDHPADFLTKLKSQIASEASNRNNALATLQQRVDLTINSNVIIEKFINGETLSSGDAATLAHNKTLSDGFSSIMAKSTQLQSDVMAMTPDQRLVFDVSDAANWAL